MRSQRPGINEMHRGWYGQPLGMLYGSGTLPEMDSSRSRDLRPTCGIERNSACV